MCCVFDKNDNFAVVLSPKHLDEGSSRFFTKTNNLVINMS